MMDKIKVKLVPLHELRPHEQFCSDHAEFLRREIQISQIWTHPIVVSNVGSIVLDGHHRFAAAKLLGLYAVPTVILDYDDPRIEVSSWRADIHVNKRDVIAAAENAALLPIKTSRHCFDFSLPIVALPITELESPGPISISA